MGGGRPMRLARAMWSRIRKVPSGRCSSPGSKNEYHRQAVAQHVGERNREQVAAAAGDAGVDVAASWSRRFASRRGCPPRPSSHSRAPSYRPCRRCDGGRRDRRERPSTLPTSAALCAVHGDRVGVARAIARGLRVGAEFVLAMTTAEHQLPGLITRLRR